MSNESFDKDDMFPEGKEEEGAGASHNLGCDGAWINTNDRTLVPPRCPTSPSSCLICRLHL